MSDGELLERIRLGQGYLLAHDRLGQCDDIRELCDRWSAARADADRLTGVIREARAHLQRGEGLSALGVLRRAIEDMPAIDRHGLKLDEQYDRLLELKARKAIEARGAAQPERPAHADGPEHPASYE